MKESESFKLFLRGRWLSVSHFLYIHILNSLHLDYCPYLLTPLSPDGSRADGCGIRHKHPYDGREPADTTVGPPADRTSVIPRPYIGHGSDAGSPLLV